MATPKVRVGERADERVIEFAATQMPPTEIRPITLGDLLAKEIPPRNNLLDPWLPAQGLAMLHAHRGVGKTHVALGIGYAVASGGRFLRWSASTPAGVLLLDGEMPEKVLQERFAAIVAASEQEAAAPFRILTPDEQPFGMPDLGTEHGQALVDELIDDEIKLIIVDNLSTLVRSGKENESEGWAPIQTWALRHRTKGRSVLFVHHSGKSGNQRGTSKREDVLDTVIGLRRPANYDPQTGAQFEVHFEKARGIYGDDVKPFVAELGQAPDGLQCWFTTSLEDDTHKRVLLLHEEGLSVTEIATDLDINKSVVSRHLKRARDAGEIAG